MTFKQRFEEGKQISMWLAEEVISQAEGAAPVCMTCGRSMPDHRRLDVLCVELASRLKAIWALPKLSDSSNFWVAAQSA